MHLEGTCLRLADAIFSSSRCSAEWCARHYGIRGAEIPVLHTGVDTELFRPSETPKAARPTILFVGKLELNKGVRQLVEAAIELAAEFPDLHLRLLGRGSDRMNQELQALVKARGVPGLLELAGFVPREELPAQLGGAHVFAAPSVYEGGPGFVYLEAMACGMPVIACAGSGAAEVIRDGETGFLVPPHDLEELVRALRLLLSDSSRRETMGMNARRYVLAEADATVCLKKLEAFYLAVAGKNAARPEA